ncbi:protein FAM83H isoform X1 [Pipistrellus kuhlii]|uniref:Family with sequence similarity 83 member H n=2 Tax=Pipistrellus kuhlii TaxID=59472 RepID=A0A7J7VMW8_PIPKU|nr:protein FAM83H isoform X1 [Pipistrellus kuhlii]KAF6326296.1 family with sequence similarity 83 member H [Pipistrellus kuhlii]
MSGKRSRARKPRARRAGRAQQAPGQQGPEAQPPPPDAAGPPDQTGVALAGHVTGSQPAARGHPEAARPERPQTVERPVPAAAPASELVPVPAADMEDGRPGGRTHSLGAELLRLQEVQLCLAQEQQLLADRRRQVQLQMQLWQEEQLWWEQLWREEQLWLQQLQEEQAWVRMEGLELAVALEQLQSEGLEVLQTQGQAPGGNMARRSQSSSQGDNPLAPGYLPPHYKEYYRLAVDALAEGGPEAYSRFLAAEGAPAFLCPEELEHVSRHLRPPQHVAPEPPEGSPPDVDMDGSSGTYWPVNSDQAVPELDLGWPLTFGFQGTEVTTLVQPPPPDSPSIKDEARRMIRSAQQVVAVVMDMFTDVDLLSEVLEAAARRVPVYILLDEMNAQHFLDTAEKCRVNLHHVDFLRVRTVAGPTYYCRTGKSFRGHVKEKFLLVDCAVVMSGSYSFMWSFEKIHRSLAHVFQGELVSSFDEEFRILFAQSEPLVPSAGALARMDAYALAPYSGAGPLMANQMIGAPTPFSFPKRAHLLFPPAREEGLGFPSFLDPDRHFLSAFRREEPRMPGGALEPHMGLRLPSRRWDAEAGPGAELAGPRGFFQARQLEMDSFKRHSYAAADGGGAVENFAAARQVSRQTFLAHGDDFRFQTSHFHRDQLYQQHYQWDPQFAPGRPQGLFEKLRAGRPGFADPEDFALGAGPRLPELGLDAHQRLDYVPSSESREVRHGSDPAFGPRGLEPGGAPRPNLGLRFPCQAAARLGPEAGLQAEPERRAGPEGRAGLRHWRLASYLSGCHGEDAGEDGLPAPMESEAYDDDVLVSGGRAAAGDLLPSSFRGPSAFPAKGSGSGGGEGAEREGPEEAGLAKQDSFRSRLNPLIQRSSRLRSSLIFAAQAEGTGGAATEKVQLLHKEQAVHEAVGPGGEAVRSAASTKVAELLEKYKGPARDASGAPATAVTASSHSKAVLSQAWREEAGPAGPERRSLESCLLDLRDSFTQRLHQEAERQPGAATLTAAQLLDTLGRSGPGPDRLPSRFLLTQGLSSSPQGQDGPPVDAPHSEQKGNPTSAYPERKGSPTPGFPTRRGSPTPGLPERQGSPTAAYPERRGSPVPPVPERRGSPVPPVPARRGSLTLAFAGEAQKAGPAEETPTGPMEVLRKGSLRLRQLLSPKSERRAEDEGGFAAPQENGQPESPRRPSLSRGDSTEAAAGEERSPRARMASATANALYSSNLRDDTKAILEQISAHGQKHRGAPTPSPAHSSPELGRPPAASGLAPDMSDKDKCSAIFRSDSLGAQGRVSRTLPASAEERDRLLRRMESMRKEKRVYSRFEVFCKKEEAGGPGGGAGEGAAEDDARDSKVGKFMPKILSSFKSKK